MRRQRHALAPEERVAASRNICAALLRSPRLAATAPCIAVYLASADEIDLTPFITECLRRNARLCAPRWDGATYHLAELKGLSPDTLTTGPHNILEPPPTSPRVASASVDVWIVPGLAFTKDGKRLGYGGGWYDRLLVHARDDAERIGVAYAFQLLDDLPSEPHDIRLTAVITP